MDMGMTADANIMFLVLIAGLLCALFLLLVSRVFQSRGRRDERRPARGESDDVRMTKSTSIGLHYFFNLIAFVVLDVLLVILILFALILKQSGIWTLAGFGAILGLMAAGFLFVNRQISGD